MNNPQPSWPLAYFVTFTCYGTWLHGREPGSVDRRHNEYGTPWLPADLERVKAMRDRMDQPPYLLDQPRRRIVLPSIQNVCAHRGWQLLALHVRTNHVHHVVQGEVDPERIMNDFKTYASRALNLAKLDGVGRKRWTRHGSTEYLWTQEQVESAVTYTLHQQGEVMEVYAAPEFSNKQRTEPRPSKPRP